MSHDFNSMQLAAPQATEWTREATAAYGRSSTSRSTVDAIRSARQPRWYEMRHAHGKVWRRATRLSKRI